MQPQLKRGRPRKGSNSIPAYRLHKASGRAVVTLRGCPVYLGRHGSPESQEKYKRVIAEWLSRGGIVGHPTDRAPLTVAELVAGFWDHVKARFKNPITQSSYRLPLRTLNSLYGSTPAKDFGPLALQALRDELLRMQKPASFGGGPYPRMYINVAILRIVKAFAWGVSKELISATHLEALRTVEPLAIGESTAPEYDERQPVCDEAVNATVECLKEPLRTMVQLQRLTGMRSTEVCIMRTRDIDTTGDVWTYKPERHKTQHKGKKRIIDIGPRAQELLRPWLRPNLQEYLFSPRRRCEEYAVELRRERFGPFVELLQEKLGTRLFRRDDVAKLTPKTQRHTIADRLFKMYRAGILKLVHRGSRGGLKGRPCQQHVFQFAKTFDINVLFTMVARAESSTFRPRVRDCYDSSKYWRAVRVAADRADARAHKERPDVPADKRLVEAWHPHRLRHAFATEVRDTFDLETASSLLSHSSKEMTETYAKPSRRRAAEAIKKIG